MKNLIAAIIILLAGMAALHSCSGCSHGGKGGGADSVPTFVKADTAEVLAMAESYLDCVRDGRYDEAVGMLRVIKNDSILPLPEKTEQSIRMQQKTFPVLEYRLTDMEFANENRVKVTYAIEFFKKDSADNIQNTITLTFAPQRINAKWYLELLDGQTFD